MIATHPVSTSPPHLGPQHRPQPLPNHQSPQQQRPAPLRPAISRLNSAPAPATVSPPITPLGSHINPNELRVMEVIAGLCSQHHMSGYSVQKFGERGCPTPYIPLTVVAPVHVEGVLKRQSLNMAMQLYYPANQSTPALSQASAPTHIFDQANGSGLQVTAVDVSMSTASYAEFPGSAASTFALKPENSAIQSPAPSAPTPFDLASFNPPVLPPPALLRTRSEPIIHPPPSPQLNEALALAISSALAPQPPPFSPFAAAAAMGVRVTPHPQVSAAVPTNGQPAVVSEAPAPPKPKTSETHPINISYILPQQLLSHISAYLASASPSVFENALNDESSAPPSLNCAEDDEFDVAHETLPSINLPPHLRLDYCINQPQQPPPITEGVSLRTAAVPAPTLAAIPPFTCIPPPSQMGPPVNERLAEAQQSIRAAITEALLPFTPVRGPVKYAVSDARSVPASIPEHEPLAALPYPLVTPQNPPTHPSPASPQRPTGPQIGNLLLSSCPGKKVRLTGPVKGRGAICRSLPQDLTRIRSLGVGLIINCLDDAELEFLGAPWSEYSQCASQLGIDVLRIPTPEGFAPLDVLRLNRVIDWVIRRYTLRGVNVLVHCRGGVGRAGLIACCWTIKMGLCGPVSEALQAIWASPKAALPATIPWSTLIMHGVLRRESFQLVERVVLTLRKRRSMKAIETYEQARFLIDFVEWLREGEEERLRGALMMRMDGVVGGDVSPVSNRSRSDGTDETMIELELENTEAHGLKGADATPVAGDFKIHVA